MDSGDRYQHQITPHDTTLRAGPSGLGNHTCLKYDEILPFDQTSISVDSVARLLLKAAQPGVILKYYLLLWWKPLKEAIPATFSSFTGAKSLGYDGGLRAVGGEGVGVLLTSRVE